jgi:Arm DNA-binding domain
MARIVGKLNARQVASAKPNKGEVSIVIYDGGNLYLQCTRGNKGYVRRRWLFRYEQDGKPYELILGPLHILTLAEAREKARTLRQQLLDGVDPLQAKRHTDAPSFSSDDAETPFPS